MRDGKPSSAGSAPVDPNAGVNPSFKDELIAQIPHLRAFARGLCGDRETADDMAQEALAKAWKSRESYKPGTNMRAWVFTILRNNYYSERRKYRLEAGFADDDPGAYVGVQESQSAAIELSDVTRALNRLPDDQKVALFLVGAGGFTYEEAARVCGCAVGTIKSRVNRGRIALAALLEDQDESASA